MNCIITCHVMFMSCHVTYHTQPPEGWKYGSGYVTSDMLKAHMPAPGPNALILLCGPKIMVEIQEKNLLGLGYTEDMIFKF